MLTAIGEILVILFLLACLTIGAAGLIQLACAVGWTRGFERGFWIALLLGTVAVLVLIVLFTLIVGIAG